MVPTPTQQLWLLHLLSHLAPVVPQSRLIIRQKNQSRRRRHQGLRAPEVVPTRSYVWYVVDVAARHAPPPLPCPPSGCATTVAARLMLWWTRSAVCVVSRLHSIIVVRRLTRMRTKKIVGWTALALAVIINGGYAGDVSPSYLCLYPVFSAIRSSKGWPREPSTATKRPWDRGANALTMSTGVLRPWPFNLIALYLLQQTVTSVYWARKYFIDAHLHTSSHYDLNIHAKVTEQGSGQKEQCSKKIGDLRYLYRECRCVIS